MSCHPALKCTGISLGVLALSATAAAAHPHVFAEARMEIVIDDAGTVEALRHVWRFDELFSSVVLLDFDDNANLKLESEELEVVGDVVRAALADFNYYTAVSQNGADIAIDAPERIHVDFQDGQVLMFFSVSPSTEMKLDGRLSFGAYDPTMYTALDFVSDRDLVVEGTAPGCKRAVIRPDPDEVIAQNQATLTEAFFNDPAGNDFSKLFATRLELTC